MAIKGEDAQGIATGDPCLPGRHCRRYPDRACAERCACIGQLGRARHRGVWRCGFRAGGAVERWRGRFGRARPSYVGQPCSGRGSGGRDDQQFYQLGELLVRDGLSSAIINLSREMNGWWYEWSEWHAQSYELDAFIRAWRHVVTAMRSVPGEHFKFLWSIYPEGTTVAECWPGGQHHGFK